MTKLSRYSVALALAVIFASLAACGSGSDKEEPAKPTVPASESMSSQAAVKADVAAKSSARELVAELEVCFVDQQTYKGCEPRGAAAGVSASTTDLGYTVTAESKSGNEFVIAKSDEGTIKRTCTRKGEGGCPSSGPSPGNSW